jgi:hypothetical protein
VDAAVWLEARADALGAEMQKKRPWLVLSRPPTFTRGLIIGPPITTISKPDGSTRTTTGLLTKGPEGTITDKGVYIDCQQLWTFLSSRIDLRSKRYPPGAPGTLAKIREKIRDYLEFSRGPRRKGLHQGKIIWIRLLPSHVEVSTGGRAFRFADEGSDLATFGKILEDMTGRNTRGPHDWLLPGVVLTNDRYLPSTPESTGPTDILPLVTVVPLVLSKPLLGPGAPRVAHPNVRSVYYAPLTQCLLTVDYLTTSSDGMQRLIVDRTGFTKWTTDDDTRRAIVDEVLGLLGM